MKTNNSSLGGRSQITRFVAGIAMVAVGALLMVGPASFAGSEVQNQLDSHILVEQTTKTVEGFCSPGTLGLTYLVHSDADMFRLTVKANSNPCSPITAHAVVYAMPGGAQGAWPQTLSEKETFTITQAGTTVITFLKDCSPMQFDVVTGATPNTISPTGNHHGPLLFPFDIGTAQQFWGKAGCAEVSGSTTTIVSPSSTIEVVETTTTTSTSTTTSTTSTPATTAPNGVLGSTTIPVPDEAGTGSSATVTAPDTPRVEGAQEVRALAVTGASNREMTLVGGGLLVAGMGLVLTSRKRLAQA